MVDRVNVSMNARDESPEAIKAREDHEAEMLKVAEQGTTNIKSTSKKDGEEHNIDLRSSDDEENNENNEETTERPENIPEKFWDAEKGEVNVEALLKSQQDAERALREAQGKKPDDKSTNEDDESSEENTNDDDKQKDAVANASAEYAEKGELSADTYAALEGVGLSKDMVNQYIEGQKAIVTSLQNAAFGEFDGSKENYNKARDWAIEHLSDDEVKAIDVQITSDNPAIVAQGAKALAAKYQANADLDPDTTEQGGGNSPTSGAYFKSGAEMQDAMSDPRYKKDQAFRDEVAKKIDRAEKRGVNLFT